MPPHHRVKKRSLSPQMSAFGETRSIPLEVMLLGSYIALLYKLELLGLLLLSASGLAFILLRSDPWRVSWPVAGLTGSYLAMATVTAFLVDANQGIQRSAQGFIVVFSAMSAVKYVANLDNLDRTRFMVLFSSINVAIIIHVIIYHLLNNHFATWKYLRDTKFAFSILILIIFFWEDRIRSISAALWISLLLTVVVIVLLSGERKAYLLAALAYPLSRSRWSTIIAVMAAGLAITALFVSVSPGSYVARQLQSALNKSDLENISNRHFFTVQAIADHSDLIRAFTNRNADRLFREHLWLGVGATGYVTWARETYGSTSENRGLSMNVHGERNRVPVESGIVGITIALSFLVAAGSRVIRFLAANTPSPTSSVRGAGYLFILMVSYIYSEALDTTMLILIAITGFTAASLPLPTQSGILRQRRSGLLRKENLAPHNIRPFNAAEVK